MSKKKIILIILAAVIVAAAIAVLLIVKPFGRKAVDVYPISELATEDYSAEENALSGTVRSEGFQNVMISKTQTVKEIYVKTGQRVNEGDLLLSYDTTLSEIELEKANLEIQKKKLELEKAKKHLDWINSLVPFSETLVKPDNSWIHYEPVTTPYLLEGTGTSADPFYYVIDSSDTFNTDFFISLLPDGGTELYTVFLIREHNAVNGKILQSFGFHVRFTDGEFSFSPFVPVIPEHIENYDEPEDPYYEYSGSEFTAAEIALMRIAATADIHKLENEIRIAQLNYEKKSKELGDGVVRASLSGTVKKVGDPASAAADGSALIQISAGGGFYVDALLSEMSLDEVKVGSIVQVSSITDDSLYEGQVTSVSDIPAQNSGSMYSNGTENSNVSYYPFTVFLSDDAKLQDGELVSISYQPASETDANSFYIDNMFLLRESGQTFVYAEGEDGRLEKRPVKTGKNLYGYATQITEGLSQDDHIAFPYGKHVTEGASTNETSVSSLYQS